MGRQIFDALLKIRNREQKNVYLKNTSFREGLAFEIDHGSVISSGVPKAVMPQQSSGMNQERFGAPRTRAVVSQEILRKLGHAVRGGTDEKLEALALKGQGAEKNDESDSSSE